MKTKNIVIAFVLLLVLGIGAYLATKKEEDRSTISFEEVAFAVPDTAAINSIQLTRSDSDKVSLSRQADQLWLINNKYTADPHYINTLLVTLHNVTIRKPVAKAQREEVSKELQTGTKVDIFQDSRLLRSFYVNPATADGSYFLHASSQDPYVVQLRGFTGNIAELFTLSQDEMRDKTLFSSTLRTLQSLKVEYAFLPQENFSINFQDAYFKVSGINEVDSTRLEDYINLYNAVYLDRFISEDEALRDSLNNVIPIATIRLKDINNNKNKDVKLYSRTGSDSVFLGILEQTNEVIVVNAEPIQNLLLRKDYFRKN